MDTFNNQEVREHRTNLDGKRLAAEINGSWGVGRDVKNGEPDWLKRQRARKAAERRRELLRQRRAAWRRRQQQRKR